MRLFRTITALTAAIIVSAIPTVGPAAAAPAGVLATCFGYSCHGLDPIAYNCSVSSTKSDSDSLVTLWNRYSATCKANWGRAQLSPAAANGGYVMQILAETIDSHGQLESQCEPGPSNTGSLGETCAGFVGGSSVYYTDMVDGTNVVQVTIKVFNSNRDFIELWTIGQ
jgi:hypothetical protein